MPLSAASTLADVQAEYKDNAPPFTSAAQCSAYVKACSILIMMLPSASGSREGNIAFQVELIQRERTDATKWLEANGGTPGFTPPPQGGSAGPRVTYVGFRNARG